MARPVHPELFGEPERRRLVRLCAAISGDRDAAEDLAQEALLEAWRNSHKLRDPAGAERWLAAIARNVCLRWARKQGRQIAVGTPAIAGVPPRDDFDLEVELERAELAELLDRALALLPAETREVLIERYVHDSPHAAIGEHLGLSEDAVSMRLSRGKTVLRRLLAAELAEEAAAFGLVDADAAWRETRVWCSECGRRRLLTRRNQPAAAIAFRCPGCNPGALRAEYRLANPVFAQLLGKLVRPTAILARGAEWSSRYFREGTDSGTVACTRCARPLPVKRYFRDRDGNRRDGVSADCDACGEQVSSSVRGLAQGVPEVRAFRREHTRTRVVPERDVEFDALPAIVVRYEDVVGSSGVDVFFARDTLRVLAVNTA